MAERLLIPRYLVIVNPDNSRTTVPINLNGFTVGSIAEIDIQGWKSSLAPITARITRIDDSGLWGVEITKIVNRWRI